MCWGIQGTLKRGLRDMIHLHVNGWHEDHSINGI
jgi:hypothetical protein